MSFPRYPAYKDSGVEWLGEVPKHWRVLRIKHLLKNLEQGWSPQCESIPVDSPDEWGVLKVGCVNGGVFNAAENKALPPELEPIPDLGIRAADLLISRANTRELVGSAAVALVDHSNLMLCDKLFRLRFDASVCSPHFIASYLSTGKVRGQIELAASGASSSMLNIGQSTILEMAVALPDSTEQVAICDFLRRETTKIDNLMAEQEKLIALLKEKRQAVISHAVTKGLDPTVPMKDSGVEWLGKVPQHWEVTHLKRFCLEITDGAHISPDTEGGVYHFISTKDLSGETIDFEGALLTSESSYEYLLKTGCRPSLGDVLFSKDGTIGRTVVVRDDREFVVASSLIIIRPDTSVLDAEYLNLLCKSFLVATQVESFVKGAGLPRLSIQNLLKVLGVFPPIGEQEEIAAFLLGKLTQFDALIEEAQHAIDLLKERRTALISAAVTGQIDVRGLIKEEQEQAA